MVYTYKFKLPNMMVKLAADVGIVYSAPKNGNTRAIPMVRKVMAAMKPNAGVSCRSARAASPINTKSHAK